jgi:DNA-binding response OmpR family regulator
VGNGKIMTMPLRVPCEDDIEVQQTHEGSILIVEDDDTLRLALRAALTRKGYSTRDTDRFSSGLAMASGEPPSLLVLDIKLPDGTGWNLLERIRSSRTDGRRFPVIVISSERVTRAQLRQYGVDKFFPKPFNMPDLVEAVEELLSSDESTELNR